MENEISLAKHIAFMSLMPASPACDTFQETNS
jgi:hypothetical protein